MLLCCLAAFCIFFLGCSKSSSSTPTPTPPAPNPGALASITVTASSTTIAVTNTSVTATASGTDSSGVTISGLTFTWSSSNPSVATIDPAAATITPVAPGVTAISASSGGVTSGPVFLTVTAPLNGQYAFLVQGFDDATGDQVAIIGSFVTDGNGTITSGVEDINGPPGGVNAFGNVPLPAEFTFTGTYTTGTGTQSPGFMTFTNSAGISNQFTFSTGTLSSGIPTVGRMTEWDDSSGSGSQRAAGSFYLQNTSAFALSSINGPYAFQFFGQKTAPGSVSTGAFTADGNGNINPGELDSNVAASGPQHIASFTGTLAANPNTPADTTTFGQLLATFTSGISQTGYVYIVSPTQALFMEADNESASGLEAGQIVAQSSPPFSNASLRGVSVEYEQGLGTTAGQPFAAIGLITFGNGTANFSRDIDDSGKLDGQSIPTATPPMAQAEALTFPSVAANGRAVLTGSPESAIIYLVNTNEGFIMSTTSSATMGFFQPQSGPFSVGTINGNYFGGTVPPTVQSMLNKTIGIPVVNDAELLSSGNGSATGTLDVSFNGGPANSLRRSNPLGFNIIVGANGRANDAPNGSDIYYLIGPSSFLMLIPAALGPALPPTPVIDIFQQ
jgi:hypothetical protein